MKSRAATEVKKFTDIPNIGPHIALQFELLGIKSPHELKRRSAIALYRTICKKTGERYDPCVLDTYMAAIDFMNGAPSTPWYFYTKERKKLYPDI